MTRFYVGTALCILAALAVIAVATFELPKVLIIAAIVVLLTGFALQLMGLWQVRPSVTLPESQVKTVQPRRGQSGFDAPRVLGVFLALLGSVGAISVAIYVTQQAGWLWALILVAIIVEQVVTTKAEYTWKPTVLGAVMGLLCAGLAAVIWYVHDANYLWAMILIGILTDTII